MILCMHPANESWRYNVMWLTSHWLDRYTMISVMAWLTRPEPLLSNMFDTIYGITRPQRVIYIIITHSWELLQMIITKHHLSPEMSWWQISGHDATSFNMIECLKLSDLGLIQGLRPANDRRRYFVTTSLIGWVQTKNQPWIWYCLRQLTMESLEKFQNDFVPFWCRVSTLVVKRLSWFLNTSVYSDDFGSRTASGYKSMRTVKPSLSFRSQY